MPAILISRQCLFLHILTATATTHLQHSDYFPRCCVGTHREAPSTTIVFCTSIQATGAHTLQVCGHKCVYNLQRRVLWTVYMTCKDVCSELCIWPAKTCTLFHATQLSCNVNDGSKSSLRCTLHPKSRASNKSKCRCTLTHLHACNGCGYHAWAVCFSCVALQCNRPLSTACSTSKAAPILCIRVAWMSCCKWLEMSKSWQAYMHICCATPALRAATN